MAAKMQDFNQLLDKFNNLVVAGIDDQVELFLKSFIFALGDNWKDVPALANEYTRYIGQTGDPSAHDLNPTQAADFLQKQDKTRTAIQRRNEIRDIDLDKNDRIAFLEYLLLHYKKMILSEFYARFEIEPEEDLSNDAIGVTGVGHKLLDELFTMPAGLSPELIAAIEEFTATKKARESKMKALREKAAQGGVKGLTAKNELEQMEKEDLTGMNRLELTLQAAKRKASKQGGEVALAEKKKKEEAEKKEKAEESRNRLKARAALFGGQ